MVTKIRKKGDVGEEKAVIFLKSRGFKILERNYQNRMGEIDIICKKGEYIHFVEVKSTYTTFQAEDNMTRNKMLKILKTAYVYVAKNKILENNVYFDLIAVNFLKNSISYYPDVLVDLY